mmetsp:Transcript_21974/g.30519  ORF Transcript_21974/g.30519 Transcript_21974/m.30519 type:complete len:116 (+) Transcript_21974:129-476(+)|eukprot:CAMPEP_0196594958 /NCGR_PEP_ID=MMETSP1081-20130531/79779_1 /TAXON_ID=36882 /ORGANISM="Pyramimonas amylifera, Strain CCMP720" /LENGTH=115 /DNA_ID=CAMNT_0041919377 /DNA_START=117 /DNA_END=464 /DNA_ORIENTATION=+
METAIDVAPVGFPHLTDVSWRVDVTLATSSLSHVMRPIILMQITLSNGKIHKFEASVEQFHELRHSVARALHEMGVLGPKVEQVVSLGRKVEKRAEVTTADKLLKSSGYFGGRGG